MKKEYLIPGSILIGCAMMALGLYFGARDGSPPGLRSGAIATSGAVVATADEPAGRSGTAARPLPAAAPAADPGAPAGLAMPGAPANVQAMVEKQAVLALEAEKKAAFIPRCWEPALKQKPEPARARFTLDMTFDGQGKEIARGISEDRSAPRVDVANCLRQIPMALQVTPPPGISVRVNLPLEFP
jgi:hypothetical protein